MKNIVQLERERFQWSIETFTEASAISSLNKLRDEIDEVENDIIFGKDDSLPEEYADCLMCLFDSAGRHGIFPEQIFEAFADKLEKNKGRTWVKNPNNTYSHLKESK